MKKLTLEQMISIGIHLGYSARNRHPKIIFYIYGIRYGVFLIDLVET